MPATGIAAALRDATNDVPDCTRNRLRLTLLPQLRRDYNPDIAASLCRLASIAAEESDFLAGEAQAAWDAMGSARQL